jgi:hypothetical protein
MEPEKNGPADEPPPALEDDPSNRRVHPRVMGPPIDISGIWGTVIDISLTGIAVTVTTPIAVGTQLDLVLTDTRSLEQRWIPAEVMWSRRDRVGLQWVDLSAEDRHWLLERFALWLDVYRETIRILDFDADDEVTAP